ncbi:hypothetical protein pb186bvf_001689 [Paramecium bursaria]
MMSIQYFIIITNIQIISMIIKYHLQIRYICKQSKILIINICLLRAIPIFLQFFLYFNYFNQNIYIHNFQQIQIQTNSHFISKEIITFKNLQIFNKILISRSICNKQQFAFKKKFIQKNH